MQPLVRLPNNPSELDWLLDVTEARQPLDESSPIWVRHKTIPDGPPLPPERHPYCEINILLQGCGDSFVEGERVTRKAGELLLFGPGLPHWGCIRQYPARFITVFFMPSVLIETGPKKDGVRILRRFTAKQRAVDRLVCPPPDLLTHLTGLFEEMVVEFEDIRFGREVKLRTLLLDLLVSVLRWESLQGRNIGGEKLEVDWEALMKALHYLRAHYSEPIYSRDLARAAGVCETTLKMLFKDALGCSWVKCLQGYRIHQAAALLTGGKCNVTEAALAVGFDNFAHFNKTFRSFLAVSPQQYRRISLSHGS